jgi:hypothetical protein
MQRDHQVRNLSSSYSSLPLRAIATRIPGLNREEMQLGNSKARANLSVFVSTDLDQIFIRHPETYFQIEKLREVWFVALS